MSLFDEVRLLVVQEISVGVGVVVALGWEIVSKNQYCHGKVGNQESEDLKYDLCLDLVDVVHQRRK